MMLDIRNVNYAFFFMSRGLNRPPRVSLLHQKAAKAPPLGDDH
jgi:hypothetical protein